MKATKQGLYSRQRANYQTGRQQLLTAAAATMSASVSIPWDFSQYLGISQK